jgi:hypothetical protein
MVVLKMPGRQNAGAQGIQPAAKALGIVDLYFYLSFRAQWLPRGLALD